VIIGGATLSMLIAFTVLRARRVVPQMLIRREALQESDLEEAALEASVE